MAKTLPASSLQGKRMPIGHLYIDKRNCINNIKSAIKHEEYHGVGSIDHIWSRSEIDKMITRTDPIICLGYGSRHTQVSVPATTTTLWGLSYFVEISLLGMYFGAQLVERD